MNYKKIKLLPLAVCLLLIVPIFVSCAGSDPSEETSKTQGSVEDVLATPSDGIGRENVSSTVPPAEDNGIVICVDPGHGFMAGGCGEGLLPDGLLEKDVNYAIATYLRDELELLGYDTIMTRDDVTFPRGPADDGNNLFNPNERAAYANTLDIDYYISIHVNSFVGDTTVRGMRIYIKETSKKIAPISEEVALALGDAVYAEFPDDKKPVVVDHTNETSFAVIRETKAPASLVEVGFATNAEDAANMVNPEWQKRVARALALGIDAHFGAEDGD